jgi:hypothetical protein
MANEFKVRKGLVVNGSGSVILDVQGSQGQLFSVTDQLSGSLFSVNDISGVPVLEAFSDSTVKIGQYLSEAIVVSGSTARITGSIAMAGFSSGSVLFAGPGGSISEDNTGLFWDNINNRLGIGTNAPIRQLDVRGAVRIETASTTELDLIGAGGNVVRISCSATTPFIGTLTNAPLGFFTSATERARVSTNGNLLVGITSDSGDRLQVSGSSRFVGDMVITGSATITNGELNLYKPTVASGRLATFFGYQLPYQHELWIEVGMNQLPETTAVLGSSNVLQNRGGFLQTVGGSRAVSFNSAGQVTIGNGQISSSQYSALSIGGPSTSLGTINTNINGVQLAVLPKEFLFTGISIGTQSFVTFNNFATSSLRSNIYASTYTNAATVYIQGAPVAGANVTFNNRYALYVETGSSYFGGGAIVSGSITANNITVTGTLTAQTIVAQTITSSILYSSGSNIFGNSLSNTQDFTGSVRITGSSHYVLGNIGIGTTSPSTIVDIRAATNTAVVPLNGSDLTGISLLLGNVGTNGVGALGQTNVGQFYIQARSRLNNGTAGQILLNPLGGNVTVGATTDTGERFQVSGSSRFAGDMVITGSINVSSLITLGQAGATSPIIYSFLNNGYTSPNPTGLNLGYFNYTTTQTGTQYHFALSGNQFNPISGDHTGLFYARTFAPSSGTATFSSVALRPTISQSSATGATAGIVINPILTSAADWRSILWTNDIGFGLYGSGTAPNFLSGSLLIGSTTNTGERLQVTGTARISQALTASAAIISGSGTQRLTVVGSGSAQPLFTVQGSQGELFSIVDSLSGSLFSVNDQSGLPIMEVFSDNTILMGNYLDPMLLTTARTSSAAGINTLYTLPTSSYDAVYIDYTIRSGSNARAGNFMAMWSGTSVNFTDNSITEFGTTSGFVFGAHISGSNMVVTGSSSTSGWTVKTIIKAI